MRTITLQVSGRIMTFSEEELVAILEKYFATTEAQPKEENTQTAENQQQAETEVAQTPTEGKWFEVNPMAIDQSLFSEEKSDKRQEMTRQLILEAFAEMENKSKYARPFKTLMPEKAWDAKLIDELREIAYNLGDHMANWYRLIEWRNGYVQIVGGSRKADNPSPATDGYGSVFPPYVVLDSTVPLVIQYM